MPGVVQNTELDKRVNSRVKFGGGPDASGGSFQEAEAHGTRSLARTGARSLASAPGGEARKSSSFPRQDCKARAAGRLAATRITVFAGLHLSWRSAIKHALEQ
jgi:hypothetical protein